MGVPAGGPSTINGVVYQMLWSLARAGQLHILGIEMAANEELSAATLILEPRSGGDLAVQDEVTTVEQVKSRSDSGTWSLRDIVAHVLPDLYLAARHATAPTQYHFATDGRIGRWQKVREFFRSLRTYSFTGDDLFAGLDNRDDLPFQRAPASASKESFWGEGSYTQRRLVERITEEVRKRNEVKDEDIDVTQRNVLRLLANLNFTWGQTAKDLEREIDATLSAIANISERIPEVRRALAMSLAEKATVGEAAINATDFFREHGLDAVPLSNWAAIRTRAGQLLECEFRTRHYNSDIDVRAEATDRIASEWTDFRPIVAVTGDTGYGKSWQLFAMADRRRHGAELSVYLEARGNADATLSAVGRQVSEEIWGQDQPLSIPRLAQRRREFHPNDRWWLNLVIDNLQEPEEARHLALQPWEDWGVRVAFGCHPSVVQVVLETAKERATAVTIGELSLEETQRYLELTLSAGWPKMPQDMVHMLRRPLLAQLFVETVADQRWQPTNEYELYSTYWKRIHQGSSAQSPLDEARLKALVRNFLDGGAYPWTDSQLHEVGLADDNVHRLDRAGWLVRTTAGTFEIPHDRLLNWAVAVTLVEDFAQQRISVTELGEKLKRYSFGDERLSGRYLGYIAMDAVWMIANDANLTGQLPTIIPLLEHHHVQMEDLYTKLLPTVGPAIVDALFRLLDERQGMLYYKKQLIDGLCVLGGEQVATKTRELLASPNKRLQRYAFLILEQLPQSECLATLWALRSEIVRDPQPWMEEHDSKYVLKGQNFDALLSCCQLTPQWLAEAAASADTNNEPVHDLAYLIASLEFSVGRPIWGAAKRELVQKISRDKQRSLARCMARFPNEADTQWLVERLALHDDLLGLSCLQALVRVDPDAAVENLDKVPLHDLQLGRNWWLPELAARLPAAFDAKIYEMMRAGDSPWMVALCYQDSEVLLTSQMLDLLLDQLDRDVTACLTGDERKYDVLYRELTFIASMNTLDHLATLRTRRGEALERSLCEFVCNIGPRKHLDRDSLAREPALEILYRIGGTGFTKAVNSFLKADTQYGRHDGLKLVTKRPDEASLLACEAIVRSDALWNDKTPIEQNDAAAVLAAHGRWHAVIDHFERWWPHVFTSLTDPMEGGQRLPNDARTNILSRLEALRDNVPPGLVDALGFGGQADDILLVRELLASADPSSELARASLLAIERLDDHSEESVPLLERFLTSEAARLARIALTVNGTDAAFEALFRHYEHTFELALAINLLNEDRTAERAVNVTKEHLKESRTHFWSNEIDDLVRHVRSANTLARIFEEQVLRDQVLARAFADEGRSWIVGSKAGAIRAVAVFDSARAIQAAKTALETPDARDRERYPYLLVEMVADETVPYLLDLLSDESSKPVEAAIGRALSVLDCRDELQRRLTSSDTKHVVSACRAIGYNTRCIDITAHLQDILHSTDETAIAEVLGALRRNRRMAEAEEIISRLLETESADEQWILLDALLELAEPGDQHRPLPEWGKRLRDKLTPYMWQHVREQLKKKRKELFEELKKQK